MQMKRKRDIHTHADIYIYIYIERERERETATRVLAQSARAANTTASLQRDKTTSVLNMILNNLMVSLH